MLFEHGLGGEQFVAVICFFGLVLLLEQRVLLLIIVGFSGVSIFCVWMTLLDLILGGVWRFWFFIYFVWEYVLIIFSLWDLSMCFYFRYAYCSKITR